MIRPPVAPPARDPISSVGQFRNRTFDKSFLPGSSLAAGVQTSQPTVVGLAKASRGRVRLSESAPLTRGMQLRQETQRNILDTAQKQSQNYLVQGARNRLSSSVGGSTISPSFQGGGHPKGLVSVGGGQALRADAAHGFARLNQAFKKTFGYALTVNSGYRSIQEQQRLYNDYKSGRSKIVAAPPGHSNHNHGTAVDIGGYGGSTNSAQFRWLLANAHRYGFSWNEGRAVNEPWHWVYVGGH